MAFPQCQGRPGNSTLYDGFPPQTTQFPQYQGWRTPYDQFQQPRTPFITCQLLAAKGEQVINAMPLPVQNEMRQKLLNITLPDAPSRWVVEWDSSDLPVFIARTSTSTQQRKTLCLSAKRAERRETIDEHNNTVETSFRPGTFPRYQSPRSATGLFTSQPAHTAPPLHIFSAPPRPLGSSFSSPHPHFSAHTIDFAPAQNSQIRSAENSDFLPHCSCPFIPHTQHQHPTHTQYQRCTYAQYQRPTHNPTMSFHPDSIWADVTSFDYYSTNLPAPTANPPIPLANIRPTGPNPTFYPGAPPSSSRAATPAATEENTQEFNDENDLFWYNPITGAYCPVTPPDSSPKADAAEEAEGAEDDELTEVDYETAPHGLPTQFGYNTAFYGMPPGYDLPATYDDVPTAAYHSATSDVHAGANYRATSFAGVGSNASQPIDLTADNDDDEDDFEDYQGTVEEEGDKVHEEEEEDDEGYGQEYQDHPEGSESTLADHLDQHAEFSFENKGYGLYEEDSDVEKVLPSVEVDQYGNPFEEFRHIYGDPSVKLEDQPEVYVLNGGIPSTHAFNDDALLHASFNEEDSIDDTFNEQYNLDEEDTHNADQHHNHLDPHAQHAENTYEQQYDATNNPDNQQRTNNPLEHHADSAGEEEAGDAYQAYSESVLDEFPDEEETRDVYQAYSESVLDEFPDEEYPMHTNEESKQAGNVNQTFAEDVTDDFTDARYSGNADQQDPNHAQAHYIPTFNATSPISATSPAAFDFTNNGPSFTVQSPVHRASSDEANSIWEETPHRPTSFNTHLNFDNNMNFGASFSSDKTYVEPTPTSFTASTQSQASKISKTASKSSRKPMKRPATLDSYMSSDEEIPKPKRKAAEDIPRAAKTARKSSYTRSTAEVPLQRESRPYAQTYDDNSSFYTSAPDYIPRRPSQPYSHSFTADGPSYFRTDDPLRNRARSTYAHTNPKPKQHTPPRNNRPSPSSRRDKKNSYRRAHATPPPSSHSFPSWARTPYREAFRAYRDNLDARIADAARNAAYHEEQARRMQEELNARRRGDEANGNGDLWAEADAREQARRRGDWAGGLGFDSPFTKPWSPNAWEYAPYEEPSVGGGGRESRRREDRRREDRRRESRTERRAERRRERTKTPVPDTIELHKQKLLSGRLDHFQALQIGRNANDEEVRRAYHKLSLACHPDKCPGDAKAGERFKVLGKAYEVLKREEGRKVYARGLRRSGP